ncbi:hypothetical protein [Aliidiomarina soli]|uniref:Uncharacterized protein n=1 Tax=Aliidiomarina soli TaxID=1928574 RepID=A0A432WE87_9GAMM|nr:hypothetical protein [Aliidiomarina soli]RUO31140.1 hypothetical protein CWE14_11635 [Aliidiomarina soli]
MEVCFDLIIPEVLTNEGSLLSEELIGWGDEQFSQDPPKYKGIGSVTFTRRPIPEHITRYLPKDLDVSDWIYLSLEQEALGAWEDAINRGDGVMAEVPLKQFLSQLLKKLDNWAIVFELNCDQIDEVYRLSSSGLLRKIEETLNWNNDPEGFIAWYKSN